IGSMRRRIETAVTNWGSARQAGLVSGPAGPSRPSAGRIETGRMYNAVTGVTNREAKDRIVIQWGWESREDFEEYYKFQEHGTAKIEAMESLHYSLHEAEDDLMGRLRRIS